MANWCTNHCATPANERVMGIEPTSEDWKSPTLTVVLYSHNTVVNLYSSRILERLFHSAKLLYSRVEGIRTPNVSLYLILNQARLANFATTPNIIIKSKSGEAGFRPQSDNRTWSLADYPYSLQVALSKNIIAEKVGVDPNPFHRTSCFQDSPAGRCSSFSIIIPLYRRSLV